MDNKSNFLFYKKSNHVAFNNCSHMSSIFYKVYVYIYYAYMLAYIHVHHMHLFKFKPSSLSHKRFQHVNRRVTQVFYNMKGQILNLTCSMKNLLEIQTLRCIFFIKIYTNEIDECIILKLIQTFYLIKCNLQIFILRFQKMLLRTSYFEQIKFNSITWFFELKYEIF